MKTAGHTNDTNTPAGEITMATFINHVLKSVRADAIETSKDCGVTTAVIKRGESIVVIIESKDGAEFTARTGAGPWSPLTEPTSTDDITAALW